MRGLLITIILLTVSCQTQKNLEKKTNSAKPAWVNSISQTVISSEAEINIKDNLVYDDTIFKFKTIKETKTAAIEESFVNDKAINVVINNGGTSQKPEVPKVSLSRIESVYNNSMGLSGGKFITQKGYEELKNETPNENTSVSPKYVIGPGDKIKLHVTGSINIKDTLSVDDKGSIFLPNRIGEITVFGKTYSQLEETIKTGLSKEFKNFKVSATLVGLRNVRVLITGKANNPGLKSLIPGSSLLDALYKSNGISKDGSLRKIIIKKKNGPEVLVDLYQLFFNGNQDIDLPLDHGDQVIILPIGKTMCLTGVAGRGIYEIKDETLKDLLDIHGQVNAFTSKERVFLERTYQKTNREIISLNMTNALELKLDDGFVIELQGVRNELDNIVEITGEIARPGKYPWKAGMSVKDLMSKGEGFLINASLHLALIKRKLNGEVIYRNSGQTTITRVREKLIWIPIDRLLAGDETVNVKLQRFDILQILSINDLQDVPQVEIIGAIRKAGKYNLTQNMSLGDLIKLAGNPSKNAYPGNGVIVRKVYNKTTRSFDVKMFHFSMLDLLNNGRSAAVTLEDGDRVIVRQAASGSVRVSIDGQVRFPGSYILPEGSTIMDLFKAAGGLLNSADLRASEFRRNSISNLQRTRMSEMFEETRQRFSRNRSFITRDGKIKESYASTMELSDLQKLEQEMNQRQIKGRVVLNFLQKEFPKSTDNLALEEGDSLSIPRKMNSILVMGHVYSPNAFIWNDELSVGEYLTMSGGYKEEAGEEEVYLIMANGVVKSAKQVGHSTLMDYIPGPGDSILVPKKEMERSNMAIASDYISIFRQAAELGAVANSISNADSAKIGINSDRSTEEVTRGGYKELLNAGGK
ncbi:MAG: SLBB domain-containing protein [Lentisphaeraceae bacterium]|nr:SLBB domain-containing protein [Lentisphaeraceae bacterium]